MIEKHWITIDTIRKDGLRDESKYEIYYTVTPPKEQAQYAIDHEDILIESDAIHALCVKGIEIGFENSPESVRPFTIKTVVYYEEGDRQINLEAKAYNKNYKIYGLDTNVKVSANDKTLEYRRTEELRNIAVELVFQHIND